MKSYLQSKQSQTYIRCTAYYQLPSVISKGSTMPQHWSLRNTSTTQRIRVCPTAFLLIYGLTKANLEGFQCAFKHNIMFYRTAYNDQTKVTNVFELGKSYLLKKSAFSVLWKSGFPHKLENTKLWLVNVLMCNIVVFTFHNQIFPVVWRNILHRVIFVSERKSYYGRLWLATTEPQNYMSIIIDGMAQTHTRIPSSANITVWSFWGPHYKNVTQTVVW